jgi:hypothetical protein
MRNTLKLCLVAIVLTCALTPSVQAGSGCRVFQDCGPWGCAWRRLCFRVPIQPYYDFYTYPREYWGHYRPWRPWKDLY